MRKLALHWKIIIGMVLGVVFGFAASAFGATEFVVDWIKPFGIIFINALKLIAIPLIVASLIKGISDLQDISQLSRIGGRTLGLFLVTTVTAVTIGLGIVNLVNPGKVVSPETREKLLAAYANDASQRIEIATSQADQGPLSFFVDMVPDNIVGAASFNGNMLQVIFFVVFFGIGLILIPPDKARPVKAFFDGVNEVVLKLIDLLMATAPYAVFALLAALVVEAPSADLFAALLSYSICVLLGLAILILGLYPLLVRLFTGVGYGAFFRGIAPAQLLAFSTSSSAATLPVTLERTTGHLGVSEDVASFVLPIGATVNMDGTSLHQAVAAVFVAQVFGLELDLTTQLGIIVTASMASIGAAAVPSAGIVMLVIVLGQAGIPVEGIALIFAVDRPLDMCRTIANVTGDATVSMAVANSVGKLDVASIAR
ncbi:dicarboxylate/amino acid:cation symporter [Neolewinella litorea]|uniref:Dicarboxylate/amino acid:cation symporter n=1 Tax=Neolewinella litorea TaxID=2562452 RepID=A0A4S4N654_9BACT|nr:dicarboxylate/amino acid:cation symporter [Neolewinella litorea]THH34596.1 dicarboxylate/amino acid:cation symporter [Neolewinella litorea]